MNNSNHFFATAKPIRLFFIVALPGLVSMLAASIYSIAEGAFVGQMIGESAFAAINIAMPIVMINFALADLIGVGSAVPISVALGRKDNSAANNYFTCSIIMIFAAGVATGLILYFTAPYIAALMGAEGQLAELAVRYVRVYAVMSPVTTIVFATDNYLRISGFVKGSMFLNIFMTILTVGFLALFLGVMKKTVEFSALSSCLSMFICAVIAIIPFAANKAVLKFVHPKFSFAMIWKIFVCGAPTFLNNISGRVTAIIMNSALIRVGEAMYMGGGETAVAAYAVLMYASGVIEPMLYGLCDSVQPAIGYNWGAKSLERVRDITKVTIAACGVISVICTVVMLAFPEALASVFVKADDIALMELSVHALRVFSGAFLIGWFSFALQGFFASIEKPLPATLISICKSMIFPVALVFALESFGLDGLWFNYAGTSILAAILGIILLLISQRTLRRDIERQPERRGD